MRMQSIMDQKTTTAGAGREARRRNEWCNSLSDYNNAPPLMWLERMISLTEAMTIFNRPVSVAFV